MGRKPRFFATAIGGTAATTDCVNDVFCFEVNGAGIVSPTADDDVVEHLTGMEKGAGEVLRVGNEILLQLKRCRYCDCISHNIDAKFLCFFFFFLFSLLAQNSTTLLSSFNTDNQCLATLAWHAILRSISSILGKFRFLNYYAQ